MWLQEGTLGENDLTQVLNCFCDLVRVGLVVRTITQIEVWLAEKLVSEDENRAVSNKETTPNTRWYAKKYL